jgi:FkbM family methyltransferase
MWLPLGRAYRRLTRRLHPHFSAVQKIGGYGPFRLDPYFYFSDFSKWGQGHNAGFAECIEACRGRICVIDIGAHIGLVTLPVASVIDTNGLVVAFEPSGVNRAMLERNVALNGFAGRVRIEPLLVGGSERGDATIHELDEPSGMNSVVDGVQKDARTIMVPQTTLDAFCERHKLAPEVIKIDVEGAELDVLAGAREVMVRHQPLIFLSVHPWQIATLGRTTAELMELISAAGYECREISGAPVTSFALKEYRLTPRTDRSGAPTSR